MSLMRYVGIAVEAAIALVAIIILHGSAVTAIDRGVFENLPHTQNVILEFDPDIDLPEGLYIRETEQPRLDVKGYAAARSLVELFVNDVSQGLVRVDESATFRRSVPLRPGLNRIAAELRTGQDDGAFWENSAELRIDRTVSPDVLPAAIFSRRSTTEGLVELVGVTMPNARLWHCEIGEDQDTLVTIASNDLGLFSLETPAGQKFLHLRLQDRADFSLVADSVIDDETIGCNRDPFHQVQTHVPEHKDGHLTRILDITVFEESVRVRATVRMAAGSSLEGWAREGLIGPREFVSHFFLLQLVEQGRPVRLTEARIQVNSLRRLPFVTLRTDFTFPSARFSLGGEQDDRHLPLLMDLPGDIVRIHVPSDSPLQYSVDPTDQDDSEGRSSLTWDSAVAQSSQFTVDLAPNERLAEERGRQEARARLNAQTQQRSPIDAIEQLRNLLPPLVNRLGFWLIAATPFIWFLAILRVQREGFPDLAALHAMAVGFLVLHASYILVWFLDFDLYALAAPVLALAKDRRIPDSVREIHYLVATPFPALLLGAAVLFLRLDQLTGQGGSALAAQPRRWGAARFLVMWPLAVVVVALILAAPLMLARFWPDWAYATATPFVLAVGAAMVGWLPVYWLLRTVFRRPVPLSLALLASLSLLVVPAVPALAQFGIGIMRGVALNHDYSPFLLPSNLYRPLWVVVCIALGIAVLYPLANRIIAISNWTPLPRWSKQRRHLVGAALLIAAVLPIKFFFGDPVNVWTLVDLFRNLTQLLPVVLLVGVYLFLTRANPADSFKLTKSEVAVGAMLFAFYLCGGRTNLLLIPIPMILGYYLYCEFLLVRQQGQTAAPKAADALDRLVALKHAEQLEHSFSDSAAKKYASGELDRDSYETGLSAARDRVEAAKAALPGETEDDVRRQIFAFGPGSGPRENAWLAVKFSVPLVVAFQIGALDRVLQRPIDTFPLLETITSLSVSVGYWVLMAFMFGHFYHLVRGRDGPSKGFAFAVALILPALVVVILNQQPILGLGAGERVLRIALFVFALAIAFDARTVRQSGLQLRHLVMIYGIAPTLTYASSLAALGGLSLGPLVKTIGCWILMVLGVDACGTAP